MPNGIRSMVANTVKKEGRQKLPKVILSCHIVSILRLHLNTQISESRRLSNHSFANPQEQHGLYSIPSMADLNNNWIITRPLRCSYNDTVWRSLPLYVKSMCHWYLNLLTNSHPLPPNRDRLSIDTWDLIKFAFLDLSTRFNTSQILKESSSSRILPKYHIM